MIVKYSKKFPYAPYLNEDIGFEMEVTDGTGKDPIDPEKVHTAINFLRSIAEKNHKDNNPGLNYDIPQGIPSAPPVIDRAYERAKETVEKLIDDSEDGVQLASHWADAQKYGLIDHYTNRLKELS